MGNKVNKVMYLDNYDLYLWGEMKPQSKLDACFDLRSAEKDAVVIPSYKATGIYCTMIRNGFCVDLRDGYELLIRPRSGLAVKHGVTLTNCVGTVDAGYHNEVCTSLINFSDKPYTIEPGERISQGALRCYDYPHAELVMVDNFDKTGKDGFGGSGRF